MKDVWMKTGLVKKLKRWSILQRRVSLMVAAGLPIAFAVAACNQPAQLAAVPAKTTVERIEGGYTDVGTGRIHLRRNGGTWRPQGDRRRLLGLLRERATGQPFRRASLR
jgi:hypothetical protein